MFRKYRHIVFFFHYSLFVVGGFAQHTEKIYLSGTGNDNTKNWEFFCTAGMNSGKWTTIPVPSCWELQGFGKYDYGFAKDSVRGKEKGLYKHSFTAPVAWKNKVVRMVFEGSMTDTEVKINGQTAGEIHQGAFYAFSYDISKLLNFGEKNLLEATVAKHSENNSVNAAERRADFWIFGGIFRPVYLEILPQDHIEQVRIDAKADGVFLADARVQGGADKMTVQLHTKNNLKYGEAIAGQKKSNGEFSFSNKFTSPSLWSSEFPNLYNAVFNLYRGGRLVHTISKKIGFRTVEVKIRDGVYVNGVKMKLKGVNRHSFWPTSGRTTSKKISIEDVLLMKDMNMNAVRMSHYPPDDHFLDVCDSLGLYVMDELAGWHGHYDTKTGSKLLKEMMVHDAHHPSIIIWSNGNEGGHNFELDDLFAKYDLQKRPVVHPWQLFGGFETQHYREYGYGIGNYEKGHDILMPTEFLHGLYDGGHGAGLEDYWEAMWRNPLSAGGFLWDFADQGVVRKDKHDSVDTDGNRGADGIIGPYHEKEGSFYTIKEVWSPVFLEHREITAAFDGTFNIENRFAFTNINQCSFSYSLETLSPENKTRVGGKIDAPALRPFEKGKLKISLPANWKGFDVIYLTARDPYQKEIFTWSFPIHLPSAVAGRLIDKRDEAVIAIKEEDSLYTVSVKDMQYRFSKTNGLLREVRKANAVIPFNNGPMIEEGLTNFSGFSFKANKDSLVIFSTYDRTKSFNTLAWTIYPSSVLKMTVQYFPAAYFTNFVGVNFSFPEKEIKSVTYMGDGPYRVWKNRMKGTKFGVWNKIYNNTETGEAPLVYPEFKGYHSCLYWCKFIAKDYSFTVATENEDVFLRLFTPAWKTDQWHNYETIFPKGDISFMQGISSIGSKTQRNETTGPMGMKNIFYDYEKDPSRALELVLYFDFSN